MGLQEQSSFLRGNVRVCMDEKRSVRNVKYDKTLDVGYLICVKLVK